MAYDTGARLQPQVWVHGNVTSPHGRARAAVEADYGRVDFDTDEGTSIATIYIEPSQHGFQMRIEQHTEDYLKITGASEPPNLEPEAYEVDREYRAQQMMILDAGLHEVAAEHAEHVFFYDDGDPFAFHPGNFVFLPAAGRNGSCFAIEERFATGTDWADDERIPIGWDWVEYGPAQMPDGTTQMRLQAEGTTVTSDTERLIDRARSWARTHSVQADAEQAVERAFYRTQQPPGQERNL